MKLDPAEKKKRDDARDTCFAAVKRGILIRPPKCSECGAPCLAEGHHRDYDKPLEVEWLCSRCHGRRPHLNVGRPVSEDPAASVVAVRLKAAQLAWMKERSQKFGVSVSRYMRSIFFEMGMPK